MPKTLGHGIAVRTCLNRSKLRKQSDQSIECDFGEGNGISACPVIYCLDRNWRTRRPCPPHWWVTPWLIYESKTGNVGDWSGEAIGRHGTFLAFHLLLHSRTNSCSLCPSGSGVFREFLMGAISEHLYSLFDHETIIALVGLMLDWRVNHGCGTCRSVC